MEWNACVRFCKRLFAIAQAQNGRIGQRGGSPGAVSSLPDLARHKFHAGTFGSRSRIKIRPETPINTAGAMERCHADIV